VHADGEPACGWITCDCGTEVDYPKRATTPGLVNPDVTQATIQQTICVSRDSSPETGLERIPVKGTEPV
jgi:hypothetical protein